MTHCNE